MDLSIQLHCTHEMSECRKGRFPGLPSFSAWAAAVLRVNVGGLTGPRLSHHAASCGSYRVTSIVPYSEMTIDSFPTINHDHL